MDTSVILMYQVVRATMFAFAYTDGGKPKEGSGSISYTLLTAYQRDHRIVALPSFFCFLSYMLFFSTVLLGPNQEFSDFLAFIENRRQFANIPSTWKPTGKKLAQALLSILITVKIGVLLPLHVCGTKAFGEQHSLLFKLAYIQAGLTLMRFKYYSGWNLADASVCASGASLTPNGSDWNLMENANI